MQLPPESWDRLQYVHIGYIWAIHADSFWLRPLGRTLTPLNLGKNRGKVPEDLHQHVLGLFAGSLVMLLLTIMSDVASSVIQSRTMLSQ